MKVLITRLFQIILVLFICFSAGMVWILSSETGLKLLVDAAKPFSPGSLKIQKVEGRLSSRIHLTGIDYSQGDIHVIIDDVAFAWNPKALLDATFAIDALIVQGVDIHLPQSQGSAPSEPRQPFKVELPSITLPFQLMLHNARVVRLNLQIEENPPIIVNELQLQLAAKEQLQLTAKLDTPFLDADVDTSLEMAHPHAVTLTVNWQGQLPDTILPEIPRTLRQGGGRGIITGNMNTLDISHHLFSPVAIQTEGKINFPLNTASNRVLNTSLDNLTWQLNLTLTEAWAFPPELISSGITLSSTAIQAKGDLKQYRFVVTTGIHGERIPSMELTLNAQGDLAGMTVNPFQIRMLDGEIKGDVDINWQKQLTAGLHWHGTHLNFASLLPDWPDSLVLNHQLRLKFSDRELTIDRLRLTIPSTDDRLDLTGIVKFEPVLSWNVDVAGSNINPGTHWPEWPGLLEVALHTDGKIDAQGVQTAVQLRKLAGELRGYPFRADSQFIMQGDEFHLRNFTLRAGDANLKANAKLGKSKHALVAEWALSVPQLQALYPHAEGKLFSRGKIDGNLTKPSLDVQLNGDALAFEAFRVENVNLKAEFLPGNGDNQQSKKKKQVPGINQGGNDQALDKQLGRGIKQSGNHLQINDKDKISLTFSSRNLIQNQTVLWEKIHLDNRGTIGSHRWQLDVQRPRERLTTQLDGTYALENPTTYQLLLQELETKTTIAGDWHLQHPSRIRIQLDDAYAGIASLLVSKLCLGSKSDELCVNAKWNDKNKLDAAWELAVSELGNLLPKAEGTLVGQGKINGNLTNPTVTLQLNGEELGFDGFELSDINLNAAYRPQTNQRMSDKDAIELNLSTRNLTQVQHRAEGRDQGKGRTKGKGKGKDKPLPTAPSLLLNNLTLNVKGNRGEHRWMLDLERPDEQLNMQLDATYPVNNPAQYRLDLQQLSANTQVMGNWELKQPTSMRITMKKRELGIESVLLDTLCLSRESADIRLFGKWGAGSTSRLTLTIDKLPLNLLEPFLPDETHLASALSGDLEAILHPNGQPKATLTFHLSPGNVTIPLEDAPYAVPIRKGEMTLRLDPKSGVTGQLALDFLTDSYIKGDITLPRQTGTSFTLQQPIQGKVGLQFSDMQLLAALVDQVENSDGQVTLEAIIDGRLDQPEIAGELSGKQLTAEIPELGIEIEKFDLHAVADGGNTIDLKSQLSSGNGYVNTSGIITLGEKEIWKADLVIEGEELEVINIPDVTAAVSPDITLWLTPDRIAVSGELLIPKADITPNVNISGSESGSGIIYESDDVVIVNPMNNENDDIPGKKSDPLNLDLNMNVILGPKVNVDVLDFKSRLGGAIGLKLSPGQAMPNGTGELQIIDGTYRAYGQDLDIPKGRILFTGGDITNPGLNISAIRTIYQDRSSNNVKQAGVQITGRAQNPHLRFFSDPMVENAQIISYIVTGSALGTDAESSVSLGTYLTPKLYVSAGISLFDQSKEFNLRYELNQKWGVEATLGDLDSGVDISYTIGR